MLITKERLTKRLNICAVCPMLRAGLLGPRCAKCGCFVKLKARLATESCPAGKW